eukprot:1193172-Prorocentrum_minimum.AAC.3
MYAVQSSDPILRPSGPPIAPPPDPLISAPPVEGARGVLLIVKAAERDHPPPNGNLRVPPPRHHPPGRSTEGQHGGARTARARKGTRKSAQVVPHATRLFGGLGGGLGPEKQRCVEESAKVAPLRRVDVVPAQAAAQSAAQSVRSVQSAVWSAQSAYSNGVVTVQTQRSDSCSGTAQFIRRSEEDALGPRQYIV